MRFDGRLLTTHTEGKNVMRCEYIFSVQDIHASTIFFKFSGKFFFDTNLDINVDR